MSHRALPQIIPGEENSSLQTAECGGLQPPLEEPANLTAPCAQVPAQIFEKRFSTAILTVFHRHSRGAAANSITDGFHTRAPCLLVAQAREHADDLQPRYSISIFSLFFSSTW